MQMHAKFEGIRLNSAVFGLVTQLGGGFQYVFFSRRKLGKISNLTNIFHMG